MSEPLTAEELEEHRSWHEQDGTACSFCERPWPCSAVQVFATIDAQRTENTRLRTALEDLLACFTPGEPKLSGKWEVAKGVDQEVRIAVLSAAAALTSTEASNG